MLQSYSNDKLTKNYKLYASIQARLINHKLRTKDYLLGEITLTVDTIPSTIQLSPYKSM